VIGVTFEDAVVFLDEACVLVVFELNWRRESAVKFDFGAAERVLRAFCIAFRENGLQ
jgi:hypothetical protein